MITFALWRAMARCAGAIIPGHAYPVSPVHSHRAWHPR